MSDPSLTEIAATLKTILKWTRFAGMQQLKSILLSTLKTNSEKMVYEFSNGRNSTRDIAKMAGLGSKTTVEKYWDKWAGIGIVEPEPRIQGRMQRICSLEEIGIDLPKTNLEPVSGNNVRNSSFPIHKYPSHLFARQCWQAYQAPPLRLLSLPRGKVSQPMMSKFLNGGVAADLINYEKGGVPRRVLDYVPPDWLKIERVAAVLESTEGTEELKSENKKGEQNVGK